MVETSKSLGIIISVFIAILLGVIFIQVVADDIEGTDDLTTTNESISVTESEGAVTNESITITSGIGFVERGAISSITYFGNATNNTNKGGISIGTDVNFTRNGKIIVTQEATMFGSNAGGYNISYVYDYDAIGQTDEDEIKSVSFFGNSTIHTNIVGISIEDEVNWTSSGVLKVSAINFSAGSYKMVYDYEGADYVDNSTARKIMDLILIFFALGILLIGVPLAMKMYPELFQ